MEHRENLRIEGRVVSESTAMRDHMYRERIADLVRKKHVLAEEYDATVDRYQCTTGAEADELREKANEIMREIRVIEKQVDMYRDALRSGADIELTSLPPEPTGESVELASAAADGAENIDIPVLLAQTVEHAQTVV